MTHEPDLRHAPDPCHPTLQARPPWTHEPGTVYWRSWPLPSLAEMRAAGTKP